MIEELHSKIMKDIIDKKLMVTLLKHSSSKPYYPVVIGGVNILRCAQLFSKSHELIGDAYRNDIDVKFVFRNNVSGVDDPMIAKAKLDRDIFLNSLIKKRDFKNILQSICKQVKTSKVTINAQVIDQANHSVEAIRLSMRSIIQLEYRVKPNDDDKETIILKPLIDTGVYHNLNTQPGFFAFKKLYLDDTDDPIPIQLFKGIPVASCAWTYFDTVRMLMQSADEYNKALLQNDDTKLTFLFGKYLKYLAKFAILYISMNRINNTPEYESLKELYHVSQQNIAKLKDKKSMIGVSADQKELLAFLVRLVTKKTNIEKLKELLSNPTPNRGKALSIYKL